jgi:structural maintenance of chromosome 4
MDANGASEGEEQREAVATPDQPRLMISKIVCTNFKSYAGVKELGPFHKCFTSIVGPNGSGKSNVIDSMLFVFGYRARKIRSKKISVLIHNSDKHRDLQSCTVAVHFQHIVDMEGDEYSVVPGSQFVISRTAHKDSSSYYCLDDTRKPFKDIAALLRESGIDLDHNRFLILQGEVEQIALMKPKAQTEHDEGMLEFLEDIIGTSRLKEPIEEMNKRVDELNEGRGEKLNRVKAVEKERASLEGAKKEAEEYLAMKIQASRKHHTLYKRYIYECGEHEQKARGRKEELEAQVKDHETVLTQVSAERKEKLKTQKKDYKVYERLAKSSEEYKESMASCEQRDVRARQDVKNARNAQKKTTKILEKEREKLKELQAAPEKHRSEITKMEAKLVTLEARREEEEQRLLEVMESLKTATVEQQKEKEEHETKLIDLKRAVNEAKSKLDVAVAELEIYREKHTRLERQIQEVETQLETVSKSLEEDQATHTSLQKSLPAKKKRLSKAQTELTALTEKWEGLRKEVGVARSNVEDAKSSMQANQSRGQVLKALMEQRDSGKIPGIHGRLGDLGAIDDKYDVAVSTACRALDHIVVDTMETAMKCVEFLKKRNIGLATFIGLDKVRREREGKKGGRC